MDVHKHRHTGADTGLHTQTQTHTRQTERHREGMNVRGPSEVDSEASVVHSTTNITELALDTG